MKIKETEAALEAILFAMGGSVELPRIARAIGVDEKTTGRIIRNMMDRYQEENRGIQIIEMENSFQMCTKKESVSDQYCPASSETGTVRCYAGNLIHHCIQTAGYKGGNREDPRGKM